MERAGVLSPRPTIGRQGREGGSHWDMYALGSDGTVAICPVCLPVCVCVCVIIYLITYFCTWSGGSQSCGPHLFTSLFYHTASLNVTISSAFTTSPRSLFHTSTTLLTKDRMTGLIAFPQEVSSTKEFFLHFQSVVCMNAKFSTDGAPDPLTLMYPVTDC